MKPPLDDGFAPASVANENFRRMANEAGPVPCAIGLERGEGVFTRHDLDLFPEGHQAAPLNAAMVERTVKFLLWQRGGHTVTIGGPHDAYEHVKQTYSAKGRLAFDVETVGKRMYGKPIEVVRASPEDVPLSTMSSLPIGRNLEGCRIGFDLGASDRKVAALIDGEPVFTEETVWDPRGNSDPEYHYRELKAGIDAAARHLPKIDAIGGSTAGVLVENKIMVSSLFRGVSERDYPKARDIFLRVAKEYGVPVEVANDGDVTALAGAMSLGVGRLLGIAMGSSEAAGYVDAQGNITGWLNELAFAPVDYAVDAPADEWSGDVGCGVQYLTQQAVFRLADRAGIDLHGSDVLAEKLKIAQHALESGHEGARRVWETIGVYCGYALAHYAEFYDLETVLVLGRVVSGEGGAIILEQADRVLETEFPRLASKIKTVLPDDKTRRVGQAVAAASLPSLEDR
ncbi:MAG TPA: hypothetical protein VNI20_06915 [Fimbriimonadaceae bacterium]|nr:hypothetical protein [Fimbriimonadaceae bacterium]